MLRIVHIKIGTLKWKKQTNNNKLNHLKNSNILTEILLTSKDLNNSCMISLYHGVNKLRFRWFYTFSILSSLTLQRVNTYILQSLKTSIKSLFSQLDSFNTCSHIGTNVKCNNKKDSITPNGISQTLLIFIWSLLHYKPILLWYSAREVYI